MGDTAGRDAREGNVADPREGPSVPAGSPDLRELPERVLARVVRGDARGRSFGTPRNPRLPTLEEFNPLMAEIPAGDLGGAIIGRRHGLFPEQVETIGQMSDEELIRFRLEDPLSATQARGGLSLTGGHHRTAEIIKRVRSGRLAPTTIIRALVHD